MIDIFSRYIVGAHVQTRESGLLAPEMMTENLCCTRYSERGARGSGYVDDEQDRPDAARRSRGHPLTFTPRGCRTTIHILQSLVKTVKYGPMWPERFASIPHARNILDAFTSWYNDEHRDTGIGLHAPADVHFGLAGQKATERAVVLAQARAQHPERSGGPTSQRSWTYPIDVWINKPSAEPDADRAPE